MRPLAVSALALALLTAPAVPQDARGRVVEGVLLAADGRPASGVLRLVPVTPLWTLDTWCGTPTRWMVASAGADGRFRFELPRDGTFRVWGEGSSASPRSPLPPGRLLPDLGTALSEPFTVERGAGADGEPLVVRLAGAGSLRGRVEYSCGVPVAGARVWLVVDGLMLPSEAEHLRARGYGDVHSAPSAGGSGAATGVTDARGGFAARGLRTTDYHLHLGASTLPPTLPMLEPMTRRPLPADGRDALVIHARPHLHVRLRAPGMGGCRQVLELAPGALHVELELELPAHVVRAQPASNRPR